MKLIIRFPNSMNVLYVTKSKHSISVYIKNFLNYSSLKELNKNHNSSKMKRFKNYLFDAVFTKFILYDKVNSKIQSNLYKNMTCRQKSKKKNLEK